jgi:hypothetical protein
MIGSAAVAGLRATYGDAARRELSGDLDQSALEVRSAIIVARERVCEVARHHALAHRHQLFAVRGERHER